MVCRVCFRVTFAKFVQPSKAELSMAVTFSGRVSSVKPAFWNAYFLMIVTVLGRSMVVRLVQFWNIPSEIFTRILGSLAFFKEVQPLNM